MPTNWESTNLSQRATLSLGCQLDDQATLPDRPIAVTKFGSIHDRDLITGCHFGQEIFSGLHEHSGRPSKPDRGFGNDLGSVSQPVEPRRRTKRVRCAPSPRGRVFMRPPGSDRPVQRCGDTPEWSLTALGRRIRRRLTFARWRGAGIPTAASVAIPRMGSPASPVPPAAGPATRRLAAR